ncbi:MAG: hypothetical protein VX899_02160 [Myxococcota bacterium]|nr:hypothetical protein [Myxococcota bacterium]
MLILLSLLLACHGVDVLGPIGSGGAAYAEGMWEARALTVQAGLAEAEALHQQGDRSAAQALVRDVYLGSFEPELEVLIREQSSAAQATELEYRFGLLEQAMGRKDAERVSELRLELEQRVLVQARDFDKAQLILR